MDDNDDDSGMETQAVGGLDERMGAFPQLLPEAAAVVVC